MNQILNRRPEFADDHFIYRTPQWLEATYLVGLLLTAGLLAYLSLSIDSMTFPITLALWLVSGSLIAFALRRRPETASIYFACDQHGLYFPASCAPAHSEGANEVPWLHVPWRNVSEIRIQLLLDEAANRKGVVLTIAATATEVRNFLSRHSVVGHRRISASGTVDGFQVGFSNFYFPHDELLDHLRRYQSPALLRRVQPIVTNIPKRTLAEN